MRRLMLLAAVVLAAVLGRFVSPAGATEAPKQTFLPLIVNGTAGGPMPPPSFPSLEAFTASVTDGQTGVVRGVYVPGIFALPVRQQPADNPTFVSGEAGVVTQFAAAAAGGVTGLLAHNYLAGADFFKLAEGQETVIVFGDGALARYRVTAIYRYQALDPYSPYSNFVDLATGETKTVGEVFALVYTGVDHVTFQTCIERSGNWSWGRLFVIATPEN